MGKKTSKLLCVMLALALLLTACGQSALRPAASSSGASTVSVEDVSESEVSPTVASSNAPTDSAENTSLPDPSEQEAATLYIGHTDQLKEVACDSEATPEALIAALAKETGWNLTLAGPVLQGGYGTSLTVAFAEDSAIYTMPPEQQKDDYHVFDAADLIYMVLNSTAETLQRNLDVKYISFTASDGGDLDFENGGCAIYLPRDYAWNEASVRASNEPLPEDSVGQVVVDPRGDICFGIQNLNLAFRREGVQPASGKITVYNDDGTIFFQCEASDTERVEEVALTQEDFKYLGWRSGSYFQIWLDKPLEAERKYSVEVEAGAFAADGLATQTLPKEIWSFTCSDYGLGMCSVPGKSRAKLGETITQELRLGDNVERIEISVENAEMGTASAERLTEDGTITFTPKKAGDFVVSFWFFFKGDTGHRGFSTTYKVVA